MHKYPPISVVIPALNEEHNLPHVLPRIPHFVSEVILVDGHSTDGTVAIARRLYPSIRILDQHGLGKGNALRQGFAASTGEIIVMLDADGSTDPVEISLFVDALMQGYDCAKGSRFLKGGGSQDITWLRTTGNFGLRVLTNFLFGTRFSDLCYGYNAFKRDCLAELILDGDGFEIETQLYLRMHRAGLTIIEVPSIEYPRQHGESNLHPFRDGSRVLLTIFKERFVPVKFTPSIISGLPYRILPDQPE